MTERLHCTEKVCKSTDKVSIKSLEINFLSENDPDVVPWSGLVDAVGDGKYHIGMTGFSLTASRFERASFVFCNCLWKFGVVQLLLAFRSIFLCLLLHLQSGTVFYYGTYSVI